MHPSSCIEREYAVRIRGDVSLEHLQKLRKGVELEDGMARFEQLTDGGGTGSNHWFHVVVKRRTQSPGQTLVGIAGLHGQPLNPYSFWLMSIYPAV